MVVYNFHTSENVWDSGNIHTIEFGKLIVLEIYIFLVNATQETRNILKSFEMEGLRVLSKI